jgi:hypothetical protein
VVFFFFQKKKQKALFCFAEERVGQTFWLAPVKLTDRIVFVELELCNILLFPEKEAKSVVLLRRRRVGQTFCDADRTAGVWLASVKLTDHIVFVKFIILESRMSREDYISFCSILLFPEKEAKSVVLLRRKAC